MTVRFVDTSVAVPLLLANHQHHLSVNAHVGDALLGLTAHSAAETYSVLTRLPGDSRVIPADALELMTERFDQLQAADQTSLDFVRRMAEVGIAGGAVYDALVALAVARVVDGVLLTRDLRAAATYMRLGVAVEFVADG